MKWWTLLILLLATLGCERVQTSGDAERETATWLSDCARPDRPGLVAIFEESRCGTVTVPEDRSSEGGRTIELKVMVIPADSPNPAPDPVLFLAGGPGQAATDIGPALFTRMSELRRERDVVLIDQRGTGELSPLSCSIDIEGLESLGASIDELTQVQVDQMRECLDTLEADPARYTTPIAIDDFNEVRRRLGYDKVNLYGGSYGTRAALVYVRRHPDTVRSMILDSVVPMTMSIPAGVAQDAQAAFDMMLTDCQKSPACADAFPGLEEDFRGMMATLADDPETVTLAHPRTGEAYDAFVEPRIITRLIRNILYDRSLTALLPLAITRAAASDYAPLATLTYAFSGGDEQGEIMNLAMMTSVLCTEDMQIANRPNDTEYFDNAIWSTLAPLCEFWPRGSVPEDYFEPVASDVPTLIVSGALDPITPPKYGFEAEKTLTNSVHVVVPGASHIATTTGCMPELVADFLESADPVSLSTGCAIDVRRPPFFTNVNGTVELSTLETEDD